MAAVKTGLFGAQQEANADMEDDRKHALVSVFEGYQAKATLGNETGLLQQKFAIINNTKAIGLFLRRVIL